MTAQPILPVRAGPKGRAPVADPVVRRWIDRRLAASPPRATSLIITVWGDAIAPHGGAVMLSGLIDLLEPFGINERLVRTSVFRLAREGWITAKPMGRRSLYRLTRAGARRFEQAYRRIYAAGEPAWDGDWELVMGDGLTQDERKALRDELSWEGFGVLAPWVYARPSRPDSAMARITGALGVEDRVLTLRAREDGTLGGQPLSSAVMRAWPIESVAAEYRRFLKSFGAVIERFRDRRPQEHDPASVLRRAHPPHPCLSARAAARSAAADRAASARLAGSGSRCAVPRFLSPDASRGRALSRRHARRPPRRASAGKRRFLRALRRAAALGKSGGTAARRRAAHAGRMQRIQWPGTNRGTSRPSANASRTSATDSENRS